MAKGFIVTIGREFGTGGRMTAKCWNLSVRSVT